MTCQLEVPNLGVVSLIRNVPALQIAKHARIATSCVDVRLDDRT